MVRTRPAGRGAKWVRLLTRSLGPLTVHAAGAAKASSAWCGRFDPLNHLEVEWVEGRTNIRRLRLANIRNHFAPAKAAPARVTPLLGCLRLAASAIPEGEPAGATVDYLVAAAEVAGVAPTGPLAGLALGYRLLAQGGWLEELPRRQGEVMAQLISASPPRLARWEWPEEVLQAWHQDLAKRWEAEVGESLGAAVPARFRG